MEQYKVGETVWVLHEGGFKREIVQVKISKVVIGKNTNNIAYVWYHYNGELEGVHVDEVDYSHEQLIDKLICDNTKKFNERTDQIRDEIKALNQKMLELESEYNSELDFLNAQKENGDGN